MESISISKNIRLSSLSQWITSAAIFAFALLIIGLRLPTDLVAGGIFVLLMCYFIISSETLQLYSIIAITVIVQLKPESTNAFEIHPLDIAAGGVIISCYLSLLKRFLLERRALAKDPLLTLFFTFMFWSAGVGLYNVIMGVTEWMSWFRELLIWSPLIVIPVLYPDVIGRSKVCKRQFFYFLIWTGIFILVASIIKIRSSLTSAVFLFEVGFPKFDIANGAFMVLLLFAVFSLYRRKPWLFVMGIFLSGISLALTFNRTAWLCALLLTPLFIFLSPGESRKSELRMVLNIILSIIILVIVIYSVLPFIWLLIEWSAVRFTTSADVKTDASLVNRYIEWRYVLDAISHSPITGYGIGGTYHVYVWIVGYSDTTGYTHNGVLGLLLKSGIVGTIMLGISYLGFAQKAIRKMRSKAANVEERLFANIALCMILMVTLFMTTLNPFNHREILLYLGLAWGYLISIEQPEMKEAR